MQLLYYTMYITNIKDKDSERVLTNVSSEIHKTLVDRWIQKILISLIMRTKKMNESYRHTSYVLHFSLSLNFYSNSSLSIGHSYTFLTSNILKYISYNTSDSVGTLRKVMRGIRTPPPSRPTCLQSLAV